MKMIKRFSEKHPVIFLIIVSAVVGMIGIIGGYIYEWITEGFYTEPVQIVSDILFLGSITGVVFGEAVILPLLLMAAEIRSLFRQVTGKKVSGRIRYIDLTAIILGIFTIFCCYLC